MKASLFLSLLILAAGAFFGWKQSQQLTTVRETHRQVVAEALALGLSPDSLLAEGKAPLPTKLAREDSQEKTAAAKSFSKELIAFAVEMKKMEKEGKQPDEAMQKRIMEVMSRFLDLSPAQIKVVIAELRASSDVDDEMRKGIVGFSIMMLANDNPESALALFTESGDLIDLPGMGNHVVASSLGKFAEKDPLGALEKHAGLVTEEAKAAVIAGAAKQDLKLALSLVGELKFKDQHKIASSLAGSARTAEERTALLSALRGDEKHAELLKGTLASLGGQLAGDGFEAGQSWLTLAALSDQEAENLADGLSHWQTKGETGQWIDWMADKLPAEKLPQKVENMVSQWTREDYQAAGAWINGTQDGPAKQAAVKSYARTVAPYEPASAAQWAVTLPAGQERDELLKNVHAEWKKKDETAAAEFAKEHGLGE
jgi:hypothetical protein